MSDPAFAPRWSFLPPIDSPKYYVLLGAIAILVLGPLGGVTAAYMNFSLGFFVGGQVLAGILGSAVTYGYGPEGKHGANYMQTMAASVAGMSGMAVLIQAMRWLGFPMPYWPYLVLYYMCIGMFGVGVGMLFTPLLVDKMRLTYPSGFAVANILRALTDKRLLQASIGKLASGTGIGLFGGVAIEKLPAIGATGMSMSTLGAGMIVGSRIAFPALVVGLVGEELKPYLVSIKWLEEGEPFRKIGFVLALGTILGAAIVDISLVGYQAISQLRKPPVATDAPPEDKWKKVSVGRLLAWVIFWAVAVVVVATTVFHQPISYVLIAVGLVFVFMLINGISLGISDSNPISSAFVLTVFILAAIGLSDAGSGLVCASILLIAVSVGGDMQQDRSTGWRLGTNRVIQFRYQVIGIAMGAFLSVGMASLFMKAYPVLEKDQTQMKKEERPEKWQSAMTYKFVGALDGLIGRSANATPEQQVKREHKKHTQTVALEIGISIGILTEILRKLLRASRGYVAFTRSGKLGAATSWTLDSVVLPSPYASSFGGFVEFTTSLWFAVGGIFSSYSDTVKEEAQKNAAPAEGEALPEDMSTNSLVGGGLIAGDSLAALGNGIAGFFR